MIDTSAEELVSFEDAAAYLPSQPHRATVWRWSQRGVRGVTLESVMVGGRRFTSIEAVDRFVAAMNQKKSPRCTAGQVIASPAKGRAVTLESF